MGELALVTQALDQLLQQSLQEGLLNDQFMQLMQLQDESNPDFVSEMVELYFEDSAGKIEKLDSKLHEPMIDYNEIDQLVHQFKGSSASFGAHQMAGVCIRLRESCHAQNADACSALVNELKHSFSALKQRLDQFQQLETRRKQLSTGP